MMPSQSDTIVQLLRFSAPCFDLTRVSRRSGWRIEPLNYLHEGQGTNPPAHWCRGSAPLGAKGDPMPTTDSGLREVAESAPSERRAPINPRELEPDPESLTDVMEGNVLVKLAAALIVVLAVIGLLLAFGG